MAKSTASSLFVLDGTEEEWNVQHWEDMPEFDQPDLDIYGSMNIAFRTEQDFVKFRQLIEQPSISIRSRGVYYPARGENDATLLRWMDEDTTEQANVSTDDI